MWWVSFEENPTFLHGLKIRFGPPRLLIKDLISPVGNGDSEILYTECFQLGPQRDGDVPSEAPGWRAPRRRGLGPASPRAHLPCGAWAPAPSQGCRARCSRSRAAPRGASMVLSRSPRATGATAALALPRGPGAARGSAWDAGWAAQVKGARCGLVRGRRPRCRRGRRWRPGAAGSWWAGGWAGRPGPVLYGPAGPREEGEGRGWGGPLGWDSPLPGRGGGGARSRAAGRET